MDDAKARQLEELTGMTREEMSQVVESFTKPPEGPAGEGRDLEVDLGEESTIDPRRLVPDTLGGTRQGEGASRTNRPTGDDGIGRNRQGGVTPPPPQLRSLVEAYQRRISGTNPAVPAPVPSGDGPPTNPPPR